MPSYQLISRPFLSGSHFAAFAQLSTATYLPSHSLIITITPKKIVLVIYERRLELYELFLILLKLVS